MKRLSIIYAAIAFALLFAEPSEDAPLGIYCLIKGVAILNYYLSAKWVERNINLT